MSERIETTHRNHTAKEKAPAMTEAAPYNYNPGQSRETILKAITDMTEHGQLISRKRLSEVTGLKMVVIDDHITRLKENGVIRSPCAGIFELVDTTPDRPISVTAMPRGSFKVEVGDDVCEALTPREALALSKLLGGVALCFGAGRG